MFNKSVAMPKPPFAAEKGEITTEIQEISTFNYAENYHQQYLHKNPNGYCDLGALSISDR